MCWCVCETHKVVNVYFSVHYNILKLKNLKLILENIILCYIQFFDEIFTIIILIGSKYPQHRGGNAKLDSNVLYADLPLAFTTFVFLFCFRLQIWHHPVIVGLSNCCSTPSEIPASLLT